jgi:hypothetical protein
LGLKKNALNGQHFWVNFALGRKRQRLLALADEKQLSENLK